MLFEDERVFKMVLKVGKYGVNSGNTFRKANARYLRQYGADSCIIRKPIPRMGDNRRKFDTGLGECDLKCDGVCFSLNKKGRWSLPELIKDEILNGDHANDDFGIQLVERHKIAKAANSISVCSTQTQAQGSQILTTKRHGYLNASSVLRRKTRYSRRERRDRLRRGLPVDIEDDEQEQEPTQIRYDVLYPSPPLSALTRNSKIIKYETVDDSYPFYYYTRRRGYRHRKRSSKHPLRDAFSIIGDEIDDSEEELAIASTDEAFSERRPITLDHIMEHSKALHKLISIPTRVRGTSGETRHQDTQIDTKSRIFHVEKEIEALTVEKINGNTQSTDISSSKTTAMEPVTVVLPFEQITPNALSERFGPYYVECDCFPRKFVLDISDQVSSLETFKGYKKNVRTVNACLAITVDEDNVMNTLKDIVCNVVLNTNFSDQMKSVKIETIFDYMESSLDKVIERTVLFMETLPDNAITLNATDSSYQHFKCNRSNVEEFSRWSTVSYQVDDEFLFKYFTSFEGHCNEATEMGYEVISYFDSVTNNKRQSATLQENMFCGICYEMIEDQSAATSLISCGHWFCNQCWREHLKTKISSGSMILPCPEYDCEKRVDPGTALSFVSMSHIMKHAKNHHDTEVERLAETRWCPNERCGRVLHVNSLNVRIAKCQCGMECCVNCLGKPHWPADCDSVKRFQKMVVARGDIGIGPVEAAVCVIVNGKHCPNCNKFVEKNGGCPYMVCVCGKSFCWGCGRSYDTTIHSNCHRYGYNDKHGTTERNIDPEDKLAKIRRRRWYKLALVHRVGQHPIKCQKMKSISRLMSKKIKEYLTRSSQRGVTITLDFDIEGKIYVRESDKTTDFLNSMIELYSEVSRLVENVAVLLDSQSSDNKELNRSLQLIAPRLGQFVNIIYDLFVNEDKRAVDETVDRLVQARRHSRNVIRTLVNRVSRKQL